MKVSLTFCAPIMRQMADSSSISPRAAITTPTENNNEADTNRNVRLAFGEMQKNPKLNLRNNV